MIYLNKKIYSLLLTIILIVVSLPTFAQEEAKNTKIAEASYGTPVIDGEIDGIWNTVNYNVIENLVATQDKSYRGWFKVLWDTEKIYVLAKVYSEHFNNIDTSPWNNDSIEFFLDENCGRTESYENDDYQLRIGFDAFISASYYDVDKIKGSTTRGTNYYIAEMAFPYKTIKPCDGLNIGFDVQVNVSKTIAFPRTLYAWNYTSGSPQINTTTHGTLVLKNSVNVVEFNEPIYTPRRIDKNFYGVSEQETVSYNENIVTTFNGEKFRYPIILVNDYPCMEIRNLANVIHGLAEGNTLSVGDIKITYTENSRLAIYGDGHLMLERSPKRINGELYVPLSSLLPTTGWCVEYARFDNLIEIETGEGYPTSEIFVNVKDYGAVGDGKHDDREAILEAFNAAVGTGKPSTLIFESEKTYRVSERQDSFEFFDMDNIDNFTLEGNNSTLLFERPNNSFLNINNCTNIKLNNLSIEYDEHTSLYGRILSVDAEKMSFVMEIPDGVALPADDEWAWYWNQTHPYGPWWFGQIMDPVEDRLKFLPFDNLFVQSINHIEGRKYKVQAKQTSPTAMALIQPDDRFVVKSRWTSYDFGEYQKYGRPDFIYVSDSKDVIFDGIYSTGALNMLVGAERNEGRIVFRNCEMRLKPGTLEVSNADGVHAANNRFGVIIENCKFSNALDDHINTKAHGAEVLDISNDYTIEVDYDLFYKEGDEIYFFNRSNHEMFAKAFVKSIEKGEKNSRGSNNYMITLDRKVEGIIPKKNSNIATLIYNMNSACTGNIVRNNIFKNSRRHGYIIRSTNSIFENNYLENNGGAAVAAMNEIYGGNEGLFPSSLTMRNNIIVGEGITTAYHPLEIKSWGAEIGEYAGIDGVLIENNFFDVPSINGIMTINSVTGLYMLNNTIKCDKPLNEATIPIAITNSSVMLIDGLNFDFKQNVPAIFNFVGCDIDVDNNIKNINIIGENSTKVYDVE